MSVTYIGNYSLCPLKVLTVSYGKCEINSSGILLGVVDYIARGKRSVRDIDNLVIGGAKSGVDNMNILNRAHISLRLNEIVNSKGACEYQKNSARKI